MKKKAKILPEPNEVVPSARDKTHLLPKIPPHEIPEPTELLPSARDKGPLPPKPLHYLPEQKKGRNLVPG